MQKQDGKGRDREERNEWFRAPRRSASSDGEARCSSAHTTSMDLQATITDVISRNRQSAIALLQGEGSEGTVNRVSVIANMEVSDADVVKAANSAFFLERRCCRTTTARPRAERGRWTPGEDDEQEDPVQGLRDDVARGFDDGWSQGSRTVPVEKALVCSTPE